MDDHEEAQLVRCAQADLAQFVRLYDRYVERIYAYVQRQTSDEPTTQDIVAITFAPVSLAWGELWCLAVSDCPQRNSPPLQSRPLTSLPFRASLRYLSHWKTQ